MEVEVMAARTLFRNRPVETSSPVLRALFDLIAERGIPMEHVAAAMPGKTTPSQLWSWRAGKRMPRLDKVEQLADAIGADIDIFYPPDQNNSK